MPPFFEKKSRVVWSKIELVDHPDEIEHPTVRETLKHLGMEEDGVEIHHYGDLPARSGMGSSSSFVVGLLHALHALRGSSPQKHDLAMDAIHIERVRAGSHVGFQDQVAAAYGGFNHATYHAGGVVTVRPLTLPSGSLEYFNDRLMMFFTGLTRTASEIAHEQINATPQKERELRQMRDIVARACAHIESPKPDFDAFGSLLHDTWMLKRGLTKSISNSAIDEHYAVARKAGALGGKLLGAGGGGFLLFYVPPDKQPAVRSALSDLLHVPFRFDHEGSKVVYQTDDEYHVRTA
jgi:D-glycero-alpha-D-manno-heptose-7-phosphate kinase